MAVWICFAGLRLYLMLDVEMLDAGCWLMDKRNQRHARGRPLILLSSFFVPVQAEDEFSGHTQLEAPQRGAVRSPAQGKKTSAVSIVPRACQSERAHWRAVGERCEGSCLVVARCVIHSCSKLVLRKRKSFSARKRQGGECDVTRRRALGSFAAKF